MRLFALLISLLVAGHALPLAAQELVPAKRLVMMQDMDLPGGDFASAFDTTLEACERACLANDGCEALTFNSRNGSCFMKAGPGEGTPYAGAVSALVRTAAADAGARAAIRRGELTFVQDWEFSAVTAQAQGLAKEHMAGGWTLAELQAAARDAEMQGDAVSAAWYAGGAVTLSDAAGDWADYARLLFAAGEMQGPDQQAQRERALQAAVNGYLRADGAAERHTVLVTMGLVLERLGRGGDTVKALRLAQALQTRDDTAALLADMAGKYGFRIVENRVESDSARPRICATFSEDLVAKGVDYASFVQLDEPGLTVSAQYRDICVEGLTHGQRATVTFREGLPAADGQELAASVDITQYIRDRSAGVRFPGRAYVLPRTGDPALPVETVNTEALDLVLYRVTDRNLIRAFQNGYLSAPMAEWQEYDFSAQTGTEVWRGTADVGMEVNRDITTRLPMAEALAGQGAGVYALRAAIPGKEAWQVPAGWQWFTVSDLALTTLSGVDGLHVFVRSLGTAEAKAGVSVELLSNGNEVLGKAATDDQGYARFDAGLTKGVGAAAPALIVAREGEADVAFLSLNDPEFDLSDRGVEGREAAPPVDVFLSTDRGAYRAGETVHATALARDSGAAAIDGLPLTVVVKRPDGVEHARQVVNDWGGGYAISQPILAGAPRGVWRMEVLADADAPPLTSTTFLVEDFLPERIDFDVALPEGLRPGEVAEIGVTARYLFGAPGADLAVEGEVLLRAAAGLPGWDGYRFGPHDAPFSAVMQGFDPARTDAAGLATVPVVLPDVGDPGMPLEARVAVRVAEGSGRPVERVSTVPLAASGPMIGVRPMFDGVVAENAEARFSLAGVGVDGTAIAMAARWELVRIETTYQWYQSYGNWMWEPVTRRERVAEGEVALDGATEIAVPVKWGEYVLTVSQADGVAVTSVPFSAGWFAAADAAATPDMLELSLDKAAYVAGDVARLRLVPRFAGKAVVMVLSNRLIAMQAVDVAEGENSIELPVTDDWGAGVYVTAQVLRPMDVAAGRNPARALGLAHAGVDPGARALTATVDVPAEVDPRGVLPVAVKVDGLTEGEAAYVTIAAVDQGILNLTGFTAPDPQAHYFGQRKLGVGIRDIYGRLIDGMNGAEGVVRSGGDAGAQARLQAPPPTEELVAYFTGPVEVGTDGLARTEFTLPAFNGTVKVMAVAWSKTGVGQASADVLVRDPVVVTASLPRFMAPGDESRVLLEIVHATGPFGTMQLAVEGRGVTVGDAPATVDLAEKGKQVIAVPVTAGDEGVQEIAVSLTTPDGKVLEKVLSLPVQRNDPEVVRVSRFDLAAGQSFAFDDAVLAGYLPGARATLAIGPLARLNAPGLLASLDRYPYGCTEQMTSKAMPLLYFDEVARAMSLPWAENVQGRVQEAIAEILTNQGAEGGFGLWSPGSGDLWLDAYVTDFLSRAKARGFVVPDAGFRMALDNLRNQVNFAPDFDFGGEALAYALMVLAREGAAAIGDLRYYADVKGDAFATPTAMAQLGAALAAYGEQTRADAMFARAGAALDAGAQETEQLFRADYGTGYRDAAAVLTLAVEAGSNAVDREALTNRIATSGLLSTQESTWALLAANALIDRPEVSGVSIDGQPAEGPLVEMRSLGAAPVTVANGGADTILTVTTFGVPEGDEAASGNGYAINRSYFALDGTPMDPATVKVGTRMIAVLEVIPFGRGEARLMVADPLPAGFEIDNPNLMTGGAVPALAGLGLMDFVTHAEYRQDRFLAAVDRMDNAPFRLGYVVRAVSPGVFRHPAASVEDMYRPDFRAVGAAGQVSVTE
ncbi:alpha-2-macroglobulin family protein [Rhodobacter sp. HX-7-19]|uniref:Alpha-2-macroglobulin family protein n=1 Tax=Paragemmobacter kunshanensis TaxID=2583234 RepID=A0A6M1TPM8_9RHOB|nr:alpha-2-macroglobulin family protein [Rhodobacter kunshanensis]NGQ90098.1 alpha-2-macroglobulin family protein [Rhodobacter kunshanensis]